jgi:cytoskeletal protein CcmA (bactofilin family)
MTDRAEIHGHLIGNLTCSGKVRLGRTAIVEGDLVAVDIEIKDGGRVSGKTEIDPETSTELPLRKGFNPTIIG